MEIVLSIYLMIDGDIIQFVSLAIGIAASICTILLYLESRQKK